MTGTVGPQIASPCAACKMLRRRCAEKCVLAPYFPPDNPQKFLIAHKVFGASAIIKTLQNLPLEQRAEAVNSMVYEATARLRDPVYGCAGMISQLEKQVSDLQSQLAIVQAELQRMRSQQANLAAIISGSVEVASVEENPFSTSYGICTPEIDDLHYSSISDVELDMPQEWGPLWILNTNKKDE